MWQEIIVGLCVGLAALAVLRQWLPRRGKTLGCGGCSNSASSCSSAKSCDKPN